jgi:tetratricopeptide (TPR) repeat protein
MRRTATFVALWLGLCVPAPLLAGGAADAILVQANAALGSGQYEVAQTLAGAGLEDAALEPVTRSRLMVLRGLAHQALGDGEKALMDFTLALQGPALSGEERARALFARGLTLDGQGRLEAAIGDYSAALGFTPRAPYALNNRGNVYRRQGRFIEARHDYVAALEANTPNPQYPNFGLGQIKEAEGDLLAARSFYSRALIADPAFTLARERLAALGAPVEGLAGLPTDRGGIVLKPPGSRPAEAPFVASPASGADTVPVVLRPPSLERLPAAVAPTPVAETSRPRAPVPPPGRGAPLRPAIVESGAAHIRSGGQVQLGAWRSEAEARDGWNRAQARAGALLAGLEPQVVIADLPGRGRYYRLRLAPKSPAVTFCRSLEAAGQDCLSVRD